MYNFCFFGCMGVNVKLDRAGILHDCVLNIFYRSRYRHDKNRTKKLCGLNKKTTKRTFKSMFTRELRVFTFRRRQGLNDREPVKIFKQLSDMQSEIFSWKNSTDWGGLNNPNHYTSMTRGTARRSRGDSKIACLTLSLRWSPGRSRRMKQINQTRGLIIHYIIWKPNSIIVLSYIC